MPLDILKILHMHFRPDSEALRILHLHATLVAAKALEISSRLDELHPDHEFIHEAAMLHDIGICLTRSPSIECTGTYPYIAHGYLGRKVLEEAGLPRHALVCERHVGAGLSIKDIVRHRLPLPPRDMIPLSLEERIICFADKFYSKARTPTPTGKPMSEVRKEIARYGEEALQRFDAWAVLFKEPFDQT